MFQDLAGQLCFQRTDKRKLLIFSLLCKDGVHGTANMERNDDALFPRRSAQVIMKTSSMTASGRQEPYRSWNSFQVHVATACPWPRSDASKRPVTLIIVLPMSRNELEGLQTACYASVWSCWFSESFCVWDVKFSIKLAVRITVTISF